MLRKKKLLGWPAPRTERARRDQEQRLSVKVPPEKKKKSKELSSDPGEAPFNKASSSAAKPAAKFHTFGHG